MKTTLIALSLAAVLSAPAFAGPKAALPPNLPPYAPDRPLPVPEIAKQTLSNGLEVWVVPRDGLPRVDYVLAVRDAGYAADAPATPAFADMLASLLAEGTASHDSRQIAELAQGYGGGLAAEADNDGLLLTGHALASHAEPMLGLLAEVTRAPAFPESEVALAKANGLESLKAAEAQPAFKANRALLAATYGHHPYSRTQATESSIAAVTPAMLKAEYARRFHPDRALLVITGKVDAKTGFAMAQQAFGDWEVAGAETPDTPAAPRQATPQHVLIQRDGSVQSTLRIGSPAIAATDPDYVPLRMASTVLGGGFSSRVMQNLREDKGYTYGARAGLTASRVGGLVSAAADVRNEVTGPALTEFFNEFKRLGSEPVPDQELTDTKRYVAGGYLISNQLQGAVAETLASNWLDGLPPEFLGEYVPKIRAVDAAQVQAMAQKYYDPAKQTIVVVGDGKAVSDQLKPFGAFQLQK